MKDKYKPKEQLINELVELRQRIAELEALEAEYKQAEELFSNLTNSSHSSVYIIQNRKLVFVNPQMQKYTGLTEDELLSMGPSSLIHPEDRERVRENAVEMLKGNRLSPYEFRVISKWGGDCMGYRDS
jgi:PAS domain S-box-containing protein